MKIKCQNQNAGMGSKNPGKGRHSNLFQTYQIVFLSKQLVSQINAFLVQVLVCYSFGNCEVN